MCQRRNRVLYCVLGLKAVRSILVESTVINKVAGGNRESLFQKLGTSLKSLRCCETKLSSGVQRTHLNVFFCVLCNAF